MVFYPQLLTPIPTKNIACHNEGRHNMSVIEKLQKYKCILFSLLVTCGVSVISVQAMSASVINKTGSATVISQKGILHLNIHITIGTKTMEAILEDNPTAREFVSLLPLTVTLRDFSSAEKVSDALSKRLSEEGAPATDAGVEGDIAYYAPWRNIAFYRGQGPDASGVIKIAKITSGIEALNQPGEMQVTLSRSN